jgi:hypothetical protein
MTGCDMAVLNPGVARLPDRRLEMRKILIAGVLVLGLASLAVAADLTGTWALDKSKSDPIGTGMRGPGGGGGGGTPPEIELSLVIKQSGSELVVGRKMTFNGEARDSENKYALDGKESVNPGMMGRGEVKSKARWDGDKLVIESNQVFQTPNGDTREMKSRDEYALSADGAVLTLTTTRTTPQGERTSKQVFNKK